LKYLYLYVKFVLNKKKYCGNSKLEKIAQTINAIEKGKFDPSLPLAFKIAGLFGSSIEEIFDDESEA